MVRFAKKAQFVLGHKACACVRASWPPAIVVSSHGKNLVELIASGGHTSGKGTPSPPFESAQLEQ
jgi:hypothetical protein